MSDRIDHVAEAIRIAEYAQSPYPGSPEVSAVYMAGAQIHATLALVEQQRIANLLMMLNWTQDATREDIGYDLDKLRTGVAGEVWEGLGLS